MVSIFWLGELVGEGTNVHINFSRKKSARRRMYEQYSMKQIKCRYNQEIVLPI